jgi:hypothetical protein
MTAPKKRSAAEAWKALEGRWADDDEVERIAALSPEELDREMATLGVDVEVQRVKAREFAAEVKRALEAKGDAKSEAPASQRPAPAVPQSTDEPREENRIIALRGWSPLWLVAAAALVFLALGVAAIAGVFDPHEPDPRPRPDQPYEPPTAPAPPTESRAAAAVRLRNEAVAACAAKAWDVCIARIDAARERDPSLASDPELQQLHTKATDELERKTLPRDGG